MAYGNHRTVHVGYTRTVSQGIHLQKKHKFEKYVTLYFYKPVIGNHLWKIVTQMDTNFMQIEVFQVSTVTKMEQN